MEVKVYLNANGSLVIDMDGVSRTISISNGCYGV